MYALRWAVASAVCLVTTLALRMRCFHPSCVDNPGKVGKWGIEKYYFTIEGRPITFSLFEFKHYKALFIQCHGSAALDSIAVPSFTTAQEVRFVDIESCLLPFRPLTATLASLNVTIQQNDMTIIDLYNISPETTLTELHFKGLERLPWLTISYTNPTTNHVLDIFKSFENIRALKLGNVPLPVKEFHSFRSSLRGLIMYNTVVEPLPVLLRELPFLKNLSLSNVEIKPKLQQATLLDTVTEPLKDSEENVSAKLQPSQLENLWLVDWAEKQMAPMEHCENLNYFHLRRPKVKQLPSGWVKQCSRLEKIWLLAGRQLVTLPGRLLEGAISLKHFNLTDSSLETLPDGILGMAPNLLIVNLSNNRLRTLSSGAFVGPALRYISLAYNLLETTAIDALVPLTNLTELDLGYNPSLTDLCDNNGYSRLQVLSQLRQLTLAAANITHICKDWLESPTLAQVDLRSTNIHDLFLFNRSSAADIKNTTLLLGKAPFTRLYDLRSKQAGKDIQINFYFT